MKLLTGYFAALLLLIGKYQLTDKTKNWVSGASAGLGLAGLGATQLLTILGFSAVTHSSGAVILTGAGGYIAGTYGIAFVVAAITAPITVVLYLVCIAIGVFVFLKRKRDTRLGT